MQTDRSTETEQKRPNDVTPRAEDEATDDEATDTEAPVAPPFVLPAGHGDDADRPIVNPVTGGAL